MKITEEFSFDEDQFFQRELKEKISNIALEYAETQKFNRSCCVACRYPEYAYAFEKEGFHYVQCKNCSTLYLSNPIVIQHYSTYKKKVLELYKKKAFKDRLKKLYEKKIFNLEVNLNRLFYQRKQIKVGFSGLKFPEFKKVLEKKFPHFVFKAVRFKKDEKFDFIMLDNLIESLLDPRSYIDSIHQSLASNGYLYVTTRLGSGIDILMLWEESKIIPLEHLNLFSKEGIEYLFKDCFDITTISTPGMLDVKLMLETDYNKLPPFLKYLKKHRGDEITEDFQYFLQKNQLSSYLVMLAKKKGGTKKKKISPSPD